MSDLVERAKELAHRAHVWQVDKAGRPYIEHVARVAAAVADDPEGEAVAWLHAKTAARLRRKYANARRALGVGNG